MLKKPELLAPAGSFEKAKIAFLYGADAVYAGPSKFTLRARTELDSDSLEETIKYAHSINKKVYVALNTYPFDNDYEEIKNEINRLDKLKADAIIASDIGVISLIKRIAPNMEIHISTQANTMSVHSARAWNELGAKRVILARELSKDKLEYIMKNKPEALEMEMFVHGALCYAYSGRCYLSDYLANRGANLGDCAQPCRWQYNISASEVMYPDRVINIDYDESGTYLFSSKDLCLIDKVDDIIKLGIESLKLEGRTKTEYYVAMVTRTYRHAIDYCYNQLINNKEYDSKEFLDELKKIQTRGFSEFYFSDEENQDIHDFDGKVGNRETVEYAGKVTESDDKTVTIEIKCKLNIDDKLEIVYPDTFSVLPFEVAFIYDVDRRKEVGTISPGMEGQLVRLEGKLAEQGVSFSDIKKGYIIRKNKE